MQTLKIADDLMADHASGVICNTIRTGHRDITLRCLALETLLSKQVVEREVVSVRHGQFNDVTDAEARANGSRDRRSLLNNMQQFYPDLTPRTPVTIIGFAVAETES